MTPDAWVQINLCLLTDKQVQMLLETNQAALILFLRLLRDEVVGKPFQSYDPIDEDGLLCLHQVGIVAGDERKGFTLAQKFLKEWTRMAPAQAPETEAKSGIKVPKSETGIFNGTFSQDAESPQSISLGNFVNLTVETVAPKSGTFSGIIEKRTILSSNISITKKRIIKNKEKEVTKKVGTKMPKAPKDDTDSEMQPGAVKDCLDVFINEAQSRFGFKPVIGTPSIVQLRRYLKKNGAEQTMKVIRFYVASEKAASLGCTLAHAFTEHTLNAMRQTEAGTYGRPTDGPARRTSGNFRGRGRDREAEPTRLDREIDAELEQIEARRREMERTTRPTRDNKNAGGKRERAGSVLPTEGIENIRGGASDPYSTGSGTLSIDGKKISFSGNGEIVISDSDGFGEIENPDG